MQAPPCPEAKAETTARGLAKYGSLRMPSAGFGICELVTRIEALFARMARAEACPSQRWRSGRLSTQESHICAIR